MRTVQNILDEMKKLVEVPETDPTKLAGIALAVDALLWVIEDDVKPLSELINEQKL